MTEVGSDLLKSTALQAFRTGNVKKLDKLVEQIRLRVLVGKREIPEAWKILLDLFPEENVWLLSKNGMCLEYLSALYFQFPEIPRQDMIQAIESFHRLGDHTALSRIYLLHEETIVDALTRLNESDI